MVSLPNPQQVKNIVGHIGTAAGTAIVLFGLQAKGVDPAKVTMAITALGDVINTAVIAIGAIGGVWAAIAAATGSSTSNVVAQTAQAIKSDPQAVAAVLPAETKTELASATVTLAANSATTNRALLAGVVDLDNVQGVVTDASTAQASPDPRITSEPGDIPKAS